MIEILEIWDIAGIDGAPDTRSALIAISENGGPEYSLGVGNIPAEGNAQAYLETRFDELWAMAQQKGVPFDVMETLRERAILKRIIVLLVEEINILREVASLPPRTVAQVKAALREAIYE